MAQAEPAPARRPRKAAAPDDAPPVKRSTKSRRAADEATDGKRPEPSLRIIEQRVLRELAAARREPAHRR